MLVCVLLLAFIATIKCALLKFDNVNVIAAPGKASYIALPRPYQGYVFKRINTPYTGYIDDNIPVLNNTDLLLNNPTVTFYNNAVISQTNIIFTTSENLSFNKTCNCGFSINKLYLTSIFINNMAVTINGYRRGVITNTRNISLILSTPYELILNWNNVDNVIIGCTNPELTTCAHIGYDNFDF